MIGVHESCFHLCINAYEIIYKNIKEDLVLGSSLGLIVMIKINPNSMKQYFSS